LLLWGRVQGGEVVLEPAFVVDAPAQLPTAPGPYALEGRDSSGALLFSLAFEAIPVADAEPGEGHFAFAVPLSSFDSDRLAEVHARAGGAVAATQRSGFAPAPGAAAAPVMIVAEPEFVPGPGGTVSVDWDAGVHPMVLVRDPDTGQILSFGRGGSATLAPRSDRVEIIFSDGVRSSEPIVRRWR
jgi:hypothetical protein